MNKRHPALEKYFRRGMRYSEGGASGAAVSAEKAEPTDENDFYNLKTHLLFRP